jgi:hypothetical protein
MTDPRKIFGRLGNQMFQYSALYKLAKDNNTDFYFQDPKWFKGCEDEIKKLFSDDIGYLPYVAIHLRRAGNPINPNEPNYSDNPFYYDLSKSGYYIDATNLFPGRKFLVFSDDIAFAKMYFEGDKFAFDESENDIDAFNRMASCDSQIIANSSFSWWAAYLNPNHSKKVVAPGVDKWFADGIKRVGYPQDWICI